MGSPSTSPTDTNAGSLPADTQWACRPASLARAVAKRGGSRKLRKRSRKTIYPRRPEVSAMRDDPGPVPTILLLVLSLTLLATCYLMSQAPQPTESGIDTTPTYYGMTSCVPSLGT